MTLVERLAPTAGHASGPQARVDHVRPGDPALARIERTWSEAARDELARQRLTAVSVEVGRPLDLGPGPCIVLKGMVASYRVLADGARQMLAVHLAGDLVDALELNRFDPLAVIAPLCSSRIGCAHPGVERAPPPALREAVLSEGLREAAICAEWLANVGRRPALPRMAHLFCELAVRSEGRGFTDGVRVRLPLTQGDLSEALGLSIVHVNRTLQQLRRLELIKLEARTLTILDRKGLTALAGFSDAYLDSRRVRAPEALRSDARGAGAGPRGAAPLMF